jgi:surface antigen
MTVLPRSRLAALIACSALLAGCATDPTKEQIGTVIGALVGAYIGSELVPEAGRDRDAAIGLGVLFGSEVGRSVGRTMDEVDRMILDHALEHSPTRRPASWQNPDSGNRYTVTPRQTYQRNRTYCRDYSIEAWVDGRYERIHGTACRQANGRWQIQS